MSHIVNIENCDHSLNGSANTFIPLYHISKMPSSPTPQLNFDIVPFIPISINPMSGLNVFAPPFHTNLNDRNHTLHVIEKSGIQEHFDQNNKLGAQRFVTTVKDTAYSILTDIRKRNPKRIIIGHLNINSIRNKIEMLSDLMKQRLDLLLISETKIDQSFPTNQFCIPGFSPPFRLDRTVHGAHGGGILMYLRADIPCKLLHCPYCSEIECLPIEVNISKKKWLVYGIYNPNKALIASHLSSLSKSIDVHSPSYDNLLIIGDFNSEITESNLNEFCSLYNFKNLVKEPTCYKSLEKPSCIDLILTNNPKSFQDTMVIESGLSDFHKLTVSVLKTAFKKEPPNIISYRNYKNYSPVNFREELNQCFSEIDIASMSNDDFVTIVGKIFNNHAPIRYKHIRANDGPFMTKKLRKAIMVRSKLRNKLNKEKTLEANLAYKKQRNICTSLLKQSKKAYYSNLNPSIITNSKLFWKTIKPVFTDKVQTNPSITLVENNDICHEDAKVAGLFNTFF